MRTLVPAGAAIRLGYPNDLIVEVISRQAPGGGDYAVRVLVRSKFRNGKPLEVWSGTWRNRVPPDHAYIVAQRAFEDHASRAAIVLASQPRTGRDPCVCGHDLDDHTNVHGQFVACFAGGCGCTGYTIPF